MVWQPEVDDINRRREMALEMGGEDRVRDQHERGKLTIRERVDGLLDEGSFRERGVLAGQTEYEGGELTRFRAAGYVVGIGEIEGRPVVVGGGDYTARPLSGTEGVRAPGRNVSKGGHDEDIALGLKLPLIRLIDGFGADIRSVEGMARTYIPELTMWPVPAKLMSQVPVVSAALGAVAGLPAAQMGICHFSIMVKDTSQIFAAGPPVVKRALGLDVSKEDLGGVQIHAHRSGLVNNVAEDEADAFAQIRRFLSYLPRNVDETPPVEECDDPVDRREEELLSLIPRDRQRPYDVRQMVELIFDRDSTFEIARHFGSSLVTMFARLNGHPVGVLANDPLRIGGAMDGPAAQKLERFVDLCDTFHLPVINLADQPGFMLGPNAEGGGTLKHGTRALCAIEAATIPWATVIVRRVYGVAGGGHQSFDRFAFRVAWPSGEWGSIPIEGGVMAAYRREIEAAEDPDAYRAEIEERMVQRRNPFGAAEAFNAEDLIDPRDTRPMLCEWLELVTDLLPPELGPKLRPMRP